MAKDDKKNLPTPQKMEQDREARIKEGLGFDDVLRAMALGITPTAPRLPEQANMTGQYFGGYPKGYTNRLGAKGTISFHVLRQIAERSPVLGAIMARKHFQRQRFARIVRRSKKGEVGMKIRHKRSVDPKFKVPPGFDALCREVENMIEHPWKVFWNEGSIYKDIEPTFASASSKITEDLLVINRPVIELGLDPVRVPRAFGVIDGANVIPTFQALRYLTSLNRDVPKEWEANFQTYRRTLQFISDKYKINLDDRTEFIYILAGKPVCGFRHDELIIAPMMQTTETRTAGYPRSLVERAVFIILAEIMAMTSNSRYFEFGSMAETMVAIKGNYDDKHINDLKQIFEGNLTGVNGMFRVPMVAMPGGAEDINVIQLKQNHKDMLFDIYIQKLTNLACAVFGMHPSEINEAPRAGDNGGSLGQASQVKQIDMAQEQGFESSLQHEKVSIWDPLVQRIDPDLEAYWDLGESEQESIDLTQKYAPIAKLNERRAMMNMEPLSDDEGGNVIDNQYVQAFQAQKQQAELAKQQQDAAANGAAPGQPTGGSPAVAPPEQEPDSDDVITGPAPGNKPSSSSKGKPGQSGNRSRPKNESGEDRINRIAALQG